MASLSGVSSRNTVSSLMNSANMISGLASGLDTEGMIENLVKSYQTKISQLNQKVTKVEWKQDAYRSIISKMAGFSSKYTSYTSSTNLLSGSFFSNAVSVSALGKYADSVSASGKTSSDISLNAVHQLAKSAQYRTKSNLSAGDGRSIEASEGINLKGMTTLSSLNGSLTLTYGSQTVSISFDQVADVKAIDEIRARRKAANEKANDEDVLAELINQKLSGQTISLSGGKTADATERIQVTVNRGEISFSDKSSAGNSVYISGASGNVGSTLGIDIELASATSAKDYPTGFKAPDSLTGQVSNRNFLSGKTMIMSLDGTTKSITLPRIASDRIGTYFVDDDGKEIKDDKGNRLVYNAENYTKLLSDAVQKAFKDKVKVSNTAKDGNLRLRFEVQEGSNLVINSSVGEALGIGQIATSSLNTGKTLGELLGEDKLSALEPAVDEDGNELLDKNGNKMYTFEINGVKVGNYTKDSKLSDLMNDINSSDAGVKVSYSSTTKNFLFESKETGANSKVELGKGLAKTMFGWSGSGTDEVSKAIQGVDWGEEKQTIAFQVPGHPDVYLDVEPDMSMEDFVDKVDALFKTIKCTASYDETTGQIIAKDEAGNKLDFKMLKAAYVEKEGQSWPDVEIGEEVKFKSASQVSYTEGQDAVFNVTVNGETINMTRSSNSVNIDGLTINMKETFNSKVDEEGNPIWGDDGKYQVASKESVTFKTSTDSDKIVDAIKAMVEDYNTMMAEIRSAYMTMPYRKSNGNFANYEPLTEEEMEGMSESAIERYEEKAKQGILFGDQTLSALYSKLNQAFSFTNKADVDTLKAMGISVGYNVSDGAQAITLDETKLRAMLDSDPDRVADLFTKTNGVMDRMKTQLDNYARTTGEPKGILIQQAGSPLSSLSLLNNNWQKEIDNYNTQIDKWQSRLEAQVERYTSQFTRLEQLIQQMNSQSSTLAGLMGGIGGS